MAKPYNGHHCWTCWNVSLWIDNDEPLYCAALECKRRPSLRTGKAPSLHVAACRFIREVVGQDARTPDGARYSMTAVKNALSGLE